MASKILLPLFLSCTLFLLFQPHLSAAQNVVKAAYWFSGSDFPVADIDSSLFTHLFCAFADLNSQTFRVTISPANQARFSSFTTTVQQKNPSVKTLLSIGGGGSDKAAFATMASQPSSRKSFIDSSITLARSNGFHGLDLDWEYPENQTQMSNFGVLLNEWRAAVSAEARNTGRPALLLSAAVTYSSNYFGLNNPVKDISNSLDWINVMAYDFTYRDANSARITGPPAALFNPDRSQVSGDSGIRAWIQAGLPAKKIVLGFPFFGHSLQLANPNNHGFWAPTSGLVNGGATGYKDIRKNFLSKGAIKVFNASVVSDYCYLGTTWIGYDDTQSVSTKVRYAKDKGLLGYFAWQIVFDDNWTLSGEASRAWGA